MNEEYFTFHLQYKHSDTFANRNCEELFLPRKSENVRPHSSKTPMKMRPHYGQSRGENATPSSGASPLASYEEVPPPPEWPIPADWESTFLSLDTLW